MYKNEIMSVEDPMDHTNTELMLDVNELFLTDPSFLGMQSFTEETMDVASKYEILHDPDVFPISRRGPPERQNITGQYNFEVEIDGSKTHRKKYLYSHRLNRIYVDMGCDFPVQFKWDTRAPAPLFVRAAAVFSHQSQAEKRVERCLQHSHESNAPPGMKACVRKNVLHSSRELGTQDVYYCGHPDYPDWWYSVAVRFLKPGSHAYKFVCKNSCSSGINRRAIHIIFTLEDATGQVLGRQSVGARVCSCLRRDMVRDEDTEAAGGKRTKRPVTPAPPVPPAPPAPPASDAPPAPPSKKIRIEVAENDDAVVTLPPLKIFGSRAVIAGLNVMLSLMEAKLERRTDQEEIENINKHITALKDYIDKNTK